MKISKLEPIVKEVLERHITTRENDHDLYYRVIYAIRPELIELTFSCIFRDYKSFKLPPFESVSRCRRKLQRKYPELQASEKVEVARIEKQEDYIEYARAVI